MKYTKIRMDFNCPLKDRFYGADLIKGNPDLLRLGATLGETLGVEFTLDFHFEAIFRVFSVAATTSGVSGSSAANLIRGKLKEKKGRTSSFLKAKDRGYGKITSPSFFLILAARSR